MAFIGKCYAGAGRTTKRNRRDGLPGQVFSRRTWQRLWRPSPPDDFWHSYASRALALGESLTMIGKLLGHSDIETTARYAHLARDSLHEAAERVAGSIAEDIL